jgi:hypothetical protein
VTQTDTERPETGQRGPVRELARLFLGQMLAVVAIAALIVAVVALVGPEGDDEIRAGVPDASETAATQSAAPESSAPPESTAPPAESSAPATNASSAPSSTASEGTSAGVPAPVEVDVLNQSAGQGSAGQTARRLREAGWEIGRVEDFRGNVSQTTVYWLDREHRRQARQVARFLGGVRVLEGFDTLVEGRVSVILVD